MANPELSDLTHTAAFLTGVFTGMFLLFKVIKVVREEFRKQNEHDAT